MQRKISTLTFGLTEFPDTNCRPNRAFVGMSNTLVVVLDSGQSRPRGYTHRVTHAVVERRLAGDTAAVWPAKTNARTVESTSNVCESSTDRLASFQFAKAEAGDGDHGRSFADVAFVEIQSL